MHIALITPFVVSSFLDMIVAVVTLAHALP